MKPLRLPMLLVFMFLYSNVHSDIINIGQRRAKISVSLQNLEDFPEFTFIGLNIAKIGTSKPIPFEVKKGEYYPIHFLMVVSFVAVKKSYLNGKNLDDIDWQNDKNIFRPDLTIHPYKLKYSARVENIKVDYKIAGFTNSAMIVYRSAETLEYKGKSWPDSICHYEYKGDITGLSKTAK